MFTRKTIIAGAALAAIGIPTLASAEVKIYPYKTHANYCPTGLQPVSINGVICCGSPNQHISYQSAMSHPVAKKRHKIRHKPIQRAKAHCPIGTKGCSID
ncbi:hypothetical protein KDD17_03500 [Sulfitobacter albidus]|uniref:Secreted protein n=1 Tax=Sulfitobacter albidus TaxID=2829501 RepID=A0A975PN54_9RHOB|nr:hypothetical protein [Sulfitobacter albidus]QUJ77106.1 hypothetical protein KDD17_03500 [Sulfitobacter albidus]